MSTWSRAPTAASTATLIKWVAPLRRLAGAALRIGAGDVEIAQGAEIEAIGRGAVAQHPLGHQLGPAIGIDRLGARLLGDRDPLGDAVGRRGRGEDEMADPALDGAFDQRAALHRVVLIIMERLGDGFGHDDRAREMHHRADPMLGDQPVDQPGLGYVAADEHGLLRHRPFEAGGEIVDHHHRPAGVEQGEHGVAADIARAPGHQHGHLHPCHALPLPKRAAARLGASLPRRGGLRHHRYPGTSRGDRR